MRRKNTALTAVIVVLVAYLILSIPGRNTPQAVGAGNTSFAWNQNRMWQSLEAGFREARAAGCMSVDPQVRKGLQEGRRHLTMLAGREFDPSDPLLVKDPMIPHHAAKMAYDEAKKQHTPYDFAMDFREPSKQFCSEVASHAYSSFGITIWNIITTMSSPGVVNWLGDFGVRHFETQAPADLEYDPQLVVVAEWRDMDTLWDDHVDNAIVEAMLEDANQGYRLSYEWYLLAPARLLKAYSTVLNRFDRVGPIPEGMSVVSALKSQWLDKMHKQTKLRVHAAAAVFEQKNGYRPPYWELVSIALEAYKVVSNRELQ